jgi:putative ABC transport system ATP-binding protein
MRKYFMISDRPTLKARHVTLVYGKGDTQTTALRDVALDLHRGQITLLMGPSGSGKSSLLSVLSGLQRPDSGKVTVLGDDLWAMSDRERERFRLRHFGFVFQGYNLFPALTARQQLELVLRWGEGAAGRDARKRAEEMLTMLGLAGKADLRPAQLSGGEKQRVAIGRALIKIPAFCFADEPTSALDWSHGEHVVDLLRSAAHERKATVLIVSHDPRLVPYADQVIHLVDGSIAEAEAEMPPHEAPVSSLRRVP